MLSQNSDSQARLDRGVQSVLAGVSANVLLAAVKLIAGIFGHSYALVADGIESIMDIFSSMVVLGALRSAPCPRMKATPTATAKPSRWPP